MSELFTVTVVESGDVYKVMARDREAAVKAARWEHKARTGKNVGLHVFRKIISTHQESKPIKRTVITEEIIGKIRRLEADGLTLTQISKKLDLCTSTVNRHMTKINKRNCMDMYQESDKMQEHAKYQRWLKEQKRKIKQSGYSRFKILYVGPYFFSYHNGKYPCTAYYQDLYKGAGV